MRAIAIIPARGGSKRIPRKNIRPFRGKPILAYAIEAALASGLFETVMVSTDDDEIAAVAEEFGAVVPFRRSAQTASDHATTAEVIQEVLGELAQRGQSFDYVTCVYPTAAFITADLLREAFGRLQTGDFDCVMPVQPFEFPVQRALRWANDRVTLLQPEYALMRTQDMEPAYHDAGMFYCLDVKRFQQVGQMIPPNTGAVRISEMQAHDIDNETDWQLAELKHQMMFS